MELDGARLTRVEAELDGRSYVALLLELPNACIMLISEGELALGTLALALPPGPPGAPPGPTSTALLGDRHVLTTRALAERLAALTGKIVLASLRAGGSEAEVGPKALEMFRRLVGGRGG